MSKPPFEPGGSIYLLKSKTGDDMAEKSNALSLLKARKIELTDEVRGIERQLDDEPSKDWEDRATERQGDEVLEALGTHDLSEIEQIDAAIRRVHDGTYGLCVKCGAAIDLRRLDALPATPFCKSCAI